MPKLPSGLFITGTDTEVGKSVVAAAICAALTAEGRRVAAFKPVVTGLDDEPGPFGRDHDLLASVSSTAAPAPYLYGPAVSPHLAADMAGEAVDPARLVAHARGLEGDFLVAEGVGGLMVPLTLGYSIRDLAVDLALPLVIVARPGLGTINHTLLTHQAAAAAGLDVRGIVITPWPGEPDAMQLSNRETIARLSGVPVLTLPQTEPASLATAGAGLSDLWAA